MGNKTAWSSSSAPERTSTLPPPPPPQNPTHRNPNSSTPPAQPPRKAPAHHQSHAATRPQPRDFCAPVQKHPSRPPTPAHLLPTLLSLLDTVLLLRPRSSAQRRPLRHLPRGARGRIRRLRPRSGRPEFGEPADRHLRVRAGRVGAGEVERAAGRVVQRGCGGGGGE